MKKLSLAVFAVLALATLMFVYGQAPTQITGAGAPSNPCGTGGQDYVDTTNHVIYHCSVPGQNWVNIGGGSSNSGGVSVTGAVTAGHVATFASSTSIQDGGVPGTGTAIGPGSSTAGHIATWSGTDGLTLADGGVVPVTAAPIFSTPVTGTSMVAAGTNTVLIGPTAMVTPGANGTYRFVVQIMETTAGSAGTCTAGTIGVMLTWKDADTAVTYTVAPAVPTIAFYPISGTGVTGAPQMTSVGPSAASNWTSVPREFRAASGVAISYDVVQQTNSNCTTPPVFAVRPALYYMGY